MENNKVSHVRTRSVALAWFVRKVYMEDLNKILDGYKQLYQFLIDFNKMNAFKRNIVIKQLEKKIEELEKREKGDVNNG